MMMRSRIISLLPAGILILAAIPMAGQTESRRDDVSPSVEASISVEAGDTILPGADYEIAAPGEKNTDARSVFVNLPVGVLDILPRTQRLDMLSYIDADSIWQAPNVMGGVSELIAAGPDYLKVRISSVSTLEVRMLPYKKGEIVMTVYSIGGENAAGDSDIRFFTPELTQLERTKFFKYPDLKDFLDIPKDAPVSFNELEQVIAFPTYEFEASPDNTSLNGHLTVGKYMTQEDFDIIKPYLRPAGVTYHWDGNKYTTRQ